MSVYATARAMSNAEFALLNGFTITMVGAILFTLSFPEMADRVLRWTASLDDWLARYLFLGRSRRARVAASETWVKKANPLLLRAVSVALMLAGGVLTATALLLLQDAK